MLSMMVPENDEKNKRQALKEAKRDPNEGKEGSDVPEDPEELKMMADTIHKAHEYMANPMLMDKLQPHLETKVKALHGLTGLAGLKEKAKLAQIREAKKSARQAK